MNVLRYHECRNLSGPYINHPLWVLFLLGVEFSGRLMSITQWQTGIQFPCMRSAMNIALGRQAKQALEYQSEIGGYLAQIPHAPWSANGL